MDIFKSIIEGWSNSLERVNAIGGMDDISFAMVFLVEVFLLDSQLILEVKIILATLPFRWIMHGGQKNSKSRRFLTPWKTWNHLVHVVNGVFFFKVPTYCGIVWSIFFVIMCCKRALLSLEPLMLRWKDTCSNSSQALTYGYGYTNNNILLIQKVWRIRRYALVFVISLYDYH